MTVLKTQLSFFHKMYVRSVLSDYIGYLIGQDSTLNGSTQIVDPAKKSSNNGNTQIRKCFRATAT